MDSLKQRQYQLREEFILDFALDLMSKKGYSTTSMDDIAQAAGISKATLYKHFPSKENMGVRAVLRSMAQGEDALRAFGPDLPAVKRLEHMLRVGIEQRAGMLGPGIAELPLSIVEDARYRQQVERIGAMITNLVENAKTAGDISQDIPTVVITSMISSLFRLDYENLLAQSQLNQAELSDAVIGVLFSGLQRKQ